MNRSEAARKGGLARAKQFTKESQAYAQSGRSHKSLSEAGRLGFSALVKSKGYDYALDKAAEWRRNNPSDLEKVVISWLDALVWVDYQREVKVDKYYVDFLIGNLVVEVNGEIWHRNDPLHGDDRIKRDSQKYKTLAQLGYTILILPEKEIKSGLAKSKIEALVKE